MPSSALDREAIEAEIDLVRSLGLDELRTLWRATFRSPPPPAFAKDLIARFLCWHIQEQAVGELDPETAKYLDGLVRRDKAEANRPRRIKPGTVLVREYQGDRHTVTVVPNGYVWHETTYASLSVIARAITDTAWKQGGALFIVWDESGDEGGSSRVAMLVVAPGLRGKLTMAMNHYSLLATVSDRLGVARLGLAKRATSLQPQLEAAAAKNPTSG